MKVKSRLILSIAPSSLSIIIHSGHETSKTTIYHTTVESFCKNFVVLGFPCNQFGGQEPGTDQEIGEFCDNNYSVTFPIFSKIKVNGPEAHPLFKLLKSDKPGIFRTQSIKWNFTKFLINNNAENKRRKITTLPRVIKKENIQKTIMNEITKTSDFCATMKKIRKQ